MKKESVYNLVLFININEIIFILNIIKLNLLIWNKIILWFSGVFRNLEMIIIRKLFEVIIYVNRLNEKMCDCF